MPRAAVVVEDRYSAVFKLDRVRPALVADGLAECQVRWPSVPVIFAETRQLAEEWTYRLPRRGEGRPPRGRARGGGERRAGPGAGAARGSAQPGGGAGVGPARGARGLGPRPGAGAAGRGLPAGPGRGYLGENSTFPQGFRKIAISASQRAIPRPRVLLDPAGDPRRQRGHSTSGGLSLSCPGVICDLPTTTALPVRAQTTCRHCGRRWRLRRNLFDRELEWVPANRMWPW